MKRIITFLALVCLMVTGAWAQATAETQAAAAKEVISDFMGENAGLTVNVTIDPNFKDNGKDKFTYTLSGSTLTIKASNGVSACRGFYDFTKSNGAGICSWSANRFKAPTSPTTTTKTVTSPYRDHQYLNVVTYGYSMPYWDENRWDKEIAWMALHGIDMPLMLVGSENIYRQVFKNLYHVSDDDIDEWEVGPANLPWMRMGNLSGNSFDGPLGQHWRTRQEALAKHILQKMGELGMRPIVPAFGGFIPKAVADIIQNNGGSYSKTGWDWVLKKCPNYRLTPIAGLGGQDGDFKKIGKEFIRLWDETFEESYGSSFKYYLSDSFNEMEVPSDPATLRSYGTEIYNAIKEGSGNTDAVWVTQGWEFIYGSGKWTNGTSSDQKFRDLTYAVPDHNFMVLSMSPEYGGYNNKKWESYSNYCGKDWINTMLPNMGGKNFWTGKLQDYATTFPNTLWNSTGSQNCTGWGITAEGIEYNEMLYELIADMGWEPNHTKNLDNWVLEYGNARYGSDKYSDKFKALHTTMRNTVYSSYIDHQNFGWQGNGKSSGYYNSGNIGTTNNTFFEGFEAFFGDENMGELQAIAENGGLDETMRADLIEFSAFYAAARVEKICKRITTANNTGNKTLANELIAELDKVMTDMDYILTGHPIYDEAKWEQKARTLAGGNIDAEKKYVKNARRIVTTWFGDHQGHEAVNDYASRIYAGIIRDYYLPRLKAELNQLVNGTACNLRDIERAFTPNGNVSTDAPALSDPGYYLGSEEKTTVPGGITSSISDAVLLANIQALVEEAQEAGQIIIEKNQVKYSTDAESFWYIINSNNATGKLTDRALTISGSTNYKGTVQANTIEATNEQIWRFIKTGENTCRMENRNGQTVTWDNGAIKTYLANIGSDVTLDLDQENTRYTISPEGMESGKGLSLASGNTPTAGNCKNGNAYVEASTWTLSEANGYIGVPLDEDFNRITRRFEGFKADVWGSTNLYGKLGQPNDASALQAAINAVATRDLALATYTDYLATYNTALETNFRVPTETEARKLFDLIISAFQIDPAVNGDVEARETFRQALIAAQTTLAKEGLTSSEATSATVTLEAAVKDYLDNAASFPYTSKAPVNGVFNEDSKVITMKMNRGGYITTASTDDSGNLTLTGINTEPTDKAGYWIVSGNDTQGYTFYNVAAGATKILAMTGQNDNARIALCSTKNVPQGATTAFKYGTNEIGGGVFYISGNNAWNNRSSNGKNYLALWNDANVFKQDTGSSLTFHVVTCEDLTPTEAANDWEWEACNSQQSTNFKASSYYDVKQITIGSASTRRQVRAKAAEQGTNTVTVTVKFSSGTHAQALYGVQLLNEDGTVAAETAYELFSLGTGATKTYTLNNVPDGSYTVRVWGAATKGNETMTANGTVEVAVNGTKDGNTQNWNKNNWYIENTAVPAGVKALAPNVGITLNTGGAAQTYYYLDKPMTFKEAGPLSVTINNKATEDIGVIGVELLKNGATLVETAGTYDGHYSDGKTNNTYTVNVPEAGNYTVRTWASYVPAKAPANGEAKYAAAAPLAPYADMPLTSGVYEIQNSPTMSSGNRGYLVDYTSYTSGPSLAECQLSGYVSKHPSNRNDGTTTSSKWYIHNDNGTYYIVSLSTLGSNTEPQFLSPATQYDHKATYSTTKVPVNIAQHSSNTVTVDGQTYHSYLITGSANNIYLCAACGTNSTSGAVTGGNNANDGGSPWVFIPCDASTLTTKQVALRNKAIEIITGSETPDDDDPTGSNPQNGKTYYIYNANWNNSADVKYYLHPSGTGLDLSSTCYEEAAYMWVCVKNGDNYNFRNVATGQWLSHKAMSNSAYNFTLAEADNSEGCFTLYSVNAQRYMVVNNAGTTFDQYNTVANKKTNGWSCDYGFVECNVGNLYFSENFDEATWLRVANCSNTGYVMTVKDDDTAGSTLHTAGTDAAEEGQLFAFVGSKENGFIIYNKKLGKTYTLTAANTNEGTAATWVLNAETPTKWYLDESQLNASSQPGYGITTSSTSGGRSLNMWAGNGGDAKFYANGAGNGGSRWQLSLVDSEPTVIHYVVNGTNTNNHVNNYVGKLNITKGTFASNTYVGTDVNGQTFNAYLPKTQEPISISNTKLHGWTCEVTGSDGNYTVTYTAEQTDYQYLAFYEHADLYRIPAIAKAQNGDLVAIYDHRVCHGDVGSGEVDQVMRRSTDGGVTWSAETMIADGSANGEQGNVFGRAFGDPALVADRESSNMTLITVSGQQLYPYATETSRPMVAALYSSDNGQNWSEPVNITNQFWGSKGAMFQDEYTEADAASKGTQFAYSGFFGSGKILQSRFTKVGSYYRLYAAMLCRGKNVSGAYVVYSDDMGRNWSLLGGDNSKQACSGSDEPKVEELPDGSIVLSGRKSYGRYFNIWTWTTKPTTDNKAGVGFWGTDVQSNQQTGGISVGSNACNGEILLVDVTNKTTGEPAKIMLQSLPSGNSRDNVEIWYKDVTNASAYSTVSTFASNWKRGLRVSTTSSAYSTMTEQADGRIGFFYEEGPATYCMVYVPLSISQITEGAYEKEVASAEVVATYTANGKETNYYEGDDINLVDAGTTELVIPADIDNVNVTYTRDFTGTSGYQAWYVPFETTVTTDITFAKILQMAYVNESGSIVEDAAEGVLAIIVDKMNTGDVVKANVPYVVKPTNSGEITFTATDLKKTKETSFVINTSTTKFTFTGSYKRYEGDTGWFYLNKSGSYSKATKPTTGVNAYRWHINTESTDLYGDDSNSPAEIRMFVLGEDEEATSIMQQITQQSSSLEGLYDITGRPMNNAVRGLYIHNGKKIFLNKK